MRFSEFFVIHHSDRKVLTFLLALATILVVLIYLTGNDAGRPCSPQPTVWLPESNLDMERDGRLLPIVPIRRRMDGR